MNAEEARALGHEIATALDRRGLRGVDRLLALFAVSWAEAQKLNMGASRLAQTAIQAFQFHTKGKGGLFDGRGG